MSDRLETELLARLSEEVGARLGLQFPADRWSDLQRGLAAAAPELGFSSTADCAAALAAAPLTQEQIDVLARHLTIGETYFFREPRTLDRVRHHILHELAPARPGAQRRLRLWSAGCCTGEEPYTLAMLLCETLPDLEQWRLDILATDLNGRFLKKAARGVYSNWSFRAMPAGLQERYFQRLPDGHWEIAPRIRNMVHFEYLNLVEDAFPAQHNGTSGLDLILCRNVLMYLSSEQIKKTAARFRDCLVDGGWFAVSASETSHALFDMFEPVAFPDAILYVKTAALTNGKTATPVAKPVSPGRVAPAVRPAPVVKAPSAPVANTDPLAEATAMAQKGQRDEALERLRQLLRLRPRHTEALALAARLSADAGRLAEARQWCDQLVEVDKLNAPAYYLRAGIQQEQGAPSEAAASLRQAIYLDDKFLLAHFALGNLLRGQGKAVEAQRQFKAAQRLLQSYRPDDILPHSEDGVSAARLSAIIAGMNP